MPAEDLQQHEQRLDDLSAVFNPLKEEFVWQIANVDYHIPPGGRKTLPRWSCHIIAKHLCDKILQEKYHVADTLRDTPLRRKVMAELLPVEAEEKPELIPSDEEAQKALNEQIDKENKMERAMGGSERPVKAKVKITPSA